ncbi:hypothetical protein NC651_022204 [Populus alba x Populus x berolinensis]|nr:hypothetical protein NC651_022181 [Populus alba x Populus x berolinensis]KAJ6895900.1 hypothetical protein NC651_022204 [Populus alba x Populus x berolinensis]
MQSLISLLSCFDSKILFLSRQLLQSSVVCSLTYRVLKFTAIREV